MAQIVLLLIIVTSLCIVPTLSSTMDDLQKCNAFFNSPDNLVQKLKTRMAKAMGKLYKAEQIAIMESYFTFLEDAKPSQHKVVSAPRGMDGIPPFRNRLVTFRRGYVTARGYISL